MNRPLALTLLFLAPIAALCSEDAETWARLRGRFAAPPPEAGTVTLYWNPHTGDQSAIEAKHETEAGSEVSRLKLTLEPLKTMFLIAQ
jgi:hypothetical protein